MGELKADTSDSASLRSWAAATIASASGCSLAFSSAGGQAQHVVLLEAGGRDDRHDLRLAFGERAGLVDNEGVDPLHPLQGLGILDQHARLRAAADTHHDRHRGRQAQRAGTGDDEDGHRRNEPERQPRLGTEHRPGREGDNGDCDHDGNEPARDLVGQALDGRAAALRLGHHLDDAREHGVAPDLLGPHDEAAGRVQRARDHLGAALLRDRHGFAGDHRFVERRAAVDQLAVDRYFFSGPDAQTIADRDGIEGNLFVGAVVLQPASGLGRQIEQRLDGPRGLFARAQLQHLAEQDEDGDDGRRLEVDRDRPVGAAERLREKPGQRDGDDAVEPGDARAHGDQGEHVEVAREQRLPAAHEERPAGPQHHRRGQGELQPVGRLLAQQHVQVREMAAHLQRHDRHRERAADPQAARHVQQFFVRPLVERDLGRFQRHAADRAASGSDLADLGMHGAGEDRARRDRRRGSGPGRLQVAERLSRELLQALRIAEVIGVSFVDGRVPGARDLHRHAADGIGGRFLGGRVVVWQWAPCG